MIVLKDIRHIANGAMKNTIIDLILSLLLGLGIILCFSPFLLYWFMHMYDGGQYAWIIQGPYPFSHLGGFGYQLGMYIILFVSGALCITAFLFGKKEKWRRILLLPFIGVTAVVILYVALAIVITG